MRGCTIQPLKPQWRVVWSGKVFEDYLGDPRPPNGFITPSMVWVLLPTKATKDVPVYPALLGEVGKSLPKREE